MTVVVDTMRSDATQHGLMGSADMDSSDGMQPVEALRVVLVYTVADAFALCPEEITWLGLHVGSLLAPFTDTMPEKLPVAVRQEMMSGSYTDMLARIERNGFATPVGDPAAMSASVDDWTNVLMRMVTECYSLSPVNEVQMRAATRDILDSLGVGHRQNPRPGRYLPVSVRYESR